MRKLLVIVAALGLVFAGPASAASAVEATSGPVQAVEVPDFTPSPTKWREFMLNVTSKMLRGASGGRVDLTGSWRAEQIANQHKFAPSDEVVRNMIRTNSYNPRYVDAPSSYDDYALKQLTRTDRKGNQVLRVQATPAQRFVKGVGTGAGAFTLMSLVPVIGSGGADVLGGWYGVDTSQGAWCAAMPGFDENLFEQILYRALDILSGRLCAFNSFDESYQVNSDLEAQYLSASYGGYTILGYVGESEYNAACFAVSWNKSQSNLATGVTSYTWNSSTNSWIAINVGAPNYNACPMPMPVGYYPGAISHSYDPSRPVPRFGIGPNPLYGAQPVELEEVPAVDVERYLECVVTLSDGSTLVLEGATYTEGSGGFEPPPCPAVPEGMHATNVAVNEHEALWV